jgi:hypothetical protein
VSSLQYSDPLDIGACLSVPSTFVCSNSFYSLFDQTCDGSGPSYQSHINDAMWDMTTPLAFSLNVQVGYNLLTGSALGSFDRYKLDRGNILIYRPSADVIQWDYSDDKNKNYYNSANTFALDTVNIFSIIFY